MQLKDNVHDYYMGYYLADDIYPTWSTFVKTIQESKVGRESFYKRIKETIKGQ
jgi:hypothetical protein